MNPHKHAKYIKAWADGHQIQVFCERRQQWEDRANPLWLNEWRYRIKPLHYDVVSNKFVTLGDDRG